MKRLTKSDVIGGGLARNKITERSSHTRIFYRKTNLKSIAKFTEKQQWTPIVCKVAGPGL